MLRRLARDASVGARRRGERERRFAPDERQPATDEVVARAELEHRVADAVLALAEPYRTTVLLAFFENLKPRVIAKRMGVPVETVRTRIKRGVEMARARVVGSSGGGSDAHGAVALLGLLDGGARSVVRRALLAKLGDVASGAAGTGGVLAMSTAAKLVLAGAVVATGALAWVTLRSRPNPTPVQPATRTAVEAAAVGQADVAAQREPAAKTVVDEEAATGSDAWLERFGLVVTPSPKGGLPLSVVVASTRAPAVGIAVLLLDEGSIQSSELATILREPERLAHKCVEIHRTDARGEVRIHWSNETRIVIALDGTMRAAAWIQQTPLLPIVLELGPPAQIEVAVRDREGAPIEAAWVDFGYAIKPVTEIVGAVRRSPTRRDGVAEIADVDLRPWTPADAVDWSVRLEGQFTPPISAPIDIEHLPKEPLVLAVGAAGAIEFEIQDEHARTFDFDGDATVDFSRSMDSRDDMTRSHLRFAKGRARVAPVALGCEWSVWVRIRHRRLRSASGAGPTRNGEVVHATIATEAAGPTVTGRLLERDGTSVANRALLAFERSVLEERGTYRGQGDSTRTDADGRFSIDLQDVDLEVVRRPLVLTTLRSATRPPCRALLDLPPHLTRGTIDLGDVTVEEFPPTITGRIVRVGGSPLAGVEVGIERLDGKTSAEEYERFGFANSTTDDDGRFAILGWPAGRYRISCRKGGYGSPRELGKEGVLSLPAQDVTLTLDRDRTDRGFVIASVLTDPLGHQMVRRIVARFQRSDGESPPATIPFDDLGRLCWNTSEVGRYDVDVTLNEVDDGREVLARVEGVEVNADAVTADPRLQQIDLRGRLREVDVTVVDPDGRPAKDALVRAFLGDAPDASARFAFAGEEPARLLTTQPLIDVEALGPDGTFASLPAASGDVTLKLERVDPVRVRVALNMPDAHSNPPFELTAILLPARSRLDGWAFWLSAKFDASGVAIATLPCGGAWRVRLMAHGKRRAANRNGEVLPDTPVAIPDGAREATCTIRLDEEMIAKLVEETREE